MNVKTSAIKEWLNKEVLITVLSGAQYQGFLNGFRHAGDNVTRIHLAKMAIIKNGKFWVHSKWNDFRWFDIRIVNVIKVV